MQEKENSGIKTIIYIGADDLINVRHGFIWLTRLFPEDSFSCMISTITSNEWLEKSRNIFKIIRVLE